MDIGWAWEIPSIPNASLDFLHFSFNNGFFSTSLVASNSAANSEQKGKLTEVRNRPAIKVSNNEQVVLKVSSVSTSIYNRSFLSTRDGRVTNVGTRFVDKTAAVVFLDLFEDR